MQNKYRPSGIRTSKYLYVIATEGYRTEPQYFDYFNPEPSTGHFRFEILKHRHKNNPNDLLDRLLDFRKKKNPGNRAEYWMVFDKDDWSNEQLDDSCMRANKNNVHVALSNPCFELWLYLHLRNNKPFFSRTEIEQALRTTLGAFEKNDYDVTMLATGLESAIKRAQVLDSNPNSTWIREQGTRVYKLMQRAITQQ